VVIFEGPLAEEDLRAIRKSGLDQKNTRHLFDHLDTETVAAINSALVPVYRTRHFLYLAGFYKFNAQEAVYQMVAGMKPWLAFFTLWSNFLELRGWTYSVDLEAYTLARKLSKKIVFLETIQEQISVLENLSHEKIIHFLKQIERWESFANDYARSYLAGDLAGLRISGVRFPSRYPSVITQRDEIFYTRMRDHLKQGQTTIFVGAPHIQGVATKLLADGFRLQGPPIPR